MSEDRSTQFIQLLTQHDRQLSLYAYALMAPSKDADDVLQESKMIMWRSFDQFELGTNFLAWARKIIFYQILVYRRQSKKQHLSLDDEMLEAIGQEVSLLAQDFDPSTDRLRECLDKLPHEHRQLISMRYFQELEVHEIAEKISSTSGAVYRALSRIRGTLSNCIENHSKVTHSSQ